MEKAEQIVVFITAGTQDEAQNIARILLDERKVACVNIVSGVESLFWWQGKIDKVAEYLLIAKSELSLLVKIVDTVKKAHNYEVPEILALPIIGGNRDYLEWIHSEVR